MLNRTIKTTANGRYFWELIFSYDNRDNTGSEITRTVRKEKTRQVNSRVFLSEKLKITTGYTFKNQTNASLSFEGVTTGGSTEHSYHIDAAMDLEEISETKTNIEETEYFEETFTVKPGDSLAAYRLCYMSDGVFISTDVISVMSVDGSPPDDIIIELQFSAKLRLLGFRLVADTLRGIRPGRDNKQEWAAIRNVIVASSSKNQFDAFHDLVIQLGNTKPGRDNKAEWSNIRNTCHEILRDWENVETQRLFHKLLSRFMATHPGSSNKSEWSRIRSVSKNVLDEVVVFFG